MASLSIQERKRLRQIGHALNPVVMLGDKGLTENVIEELERALNDHELIKVARDILENNKDIAHAMVKALMEWETIDREQIRDIMEGREPKPPKVYVSDNPVIDVTPKDGPLTPPPLPAN